MNANVQGLTLEDATARLRTYNSKATVRAAPNYQVPPTQWQIECGRVTERSDMMACGCEDGCECWRDECEKPALDRFAAWCRAEFPPGFPIAGYVGEKGDLLATIMVLQ